MGNRRTQVAGPCCPLRPLTARPAILCHPAPGPSYLGSSSGDRPGATVTVGLQGD